MDREMLIEAAKRSCEHNWMTNYLIPLCSECGFTEDGFRYFNRGVEKGFDFALSLLKWKSVADGLPEVDGNYFVMLTAPLDHGLSLDPMDDAEPLAFNDTYREFWLDNVAAYIPVPIPEYVKEQR